MRSLEVILVYQIVDAFTLVRTNILGVRVSQLLVMLNSEVLSLYFLLELFTLSVADRRHVEALVNGRLFLGHLASFSASFHIRTILELVAQVEVATILGNSLSDTALKMGIALVVLVLVERVLTMINLMLVRALLRTKAEAHSEDTVRIFRITSAIVLANLGWLILIMLSLRMICHVRANLLVWRVLSLLADRIVGLLHKSVHTLVKVDMPRVHLLLIAMVRVQ